MKNENYINNLNVIKNMLDKSTYDEKKKIMSEVINKNIELINKKAVNLWVNCFSSFVGVFNYVCSLK